MIATNQTISEQATPKSSPLKNENFIGITRRLASLKMSANAFRLMSFLIGAYGHDGCIFFMRGTLSNLIQASKATVDRSIAELKALGLIETRNRNGRALRFMLTDLCWDDPKPSHHGRRLRVITRDDSPINRIEKNVLKETTTQNEPLPDPSPPPIEPKPDPPVVDAIASAVSSEIEVEKIRNQISPEINAHISNKSLHAIWDALKNMGLDNAQILNHIKMNSNRAMKKWSEGKITNSNPSAWFMASVKIAPVTNNKKGSNMCEETRFKEIPPPVLAVPQTLEQFEINKEILKKYQCYNRCVYRPCSAMIGTGKPTESCKKYCPLFTKPRVI